MSKMQVCLCQWDYIIKCNENENDNEKLDRINKTNRPKVNIETNMQDIGCLYVIRNT